jgi:hypothetical protein
MWGTTRTHARTHTKLNPVEIQTPAHWNLIVGGMTVPPPVAA